MHSKSMHGLRKRGATNFGSEALPIALAYWRKCERCCSTTAPQLLAESGPITAGGSDMRAQFSPVRHQSTSPKRSRTPPILPHPRRRLRRSGRRPKCRKRCRKSNRPGNFRGVCLSAVNTEERRSGPVVNKNTGPISQDAKGSACQSSPSSSAMMPTASSAAPARRPTRMASVCNVTYAKQDCEKKGRGRNSRHSARIDGETSTRGPAQILFLVGTTIDAHPFRTRPQAVASPAAYRLPCRLSRNPWPSPPS